MNAFLFVFLVVILFLASIIFWQKMIYDKFEVIKGVRVIDFH
jgi:hypothetical protein